jgi:hypothetical protein
MRIIVVKSQAVTREEIWQIHHQLNLSWSHRKVVVVSRDERIPAIKFGLDLVIFW